MSNEKSLFEVINEYYRHEKRYSPARNLVYYWIDQYINEKIKWVSCQIITEKRNILDKYFFDCYDCQGEVIRNSLLATIKLSLIFKEKVNFDYDFNIEDFIIILSDKIEIPLAKDEFHPFVAAIDLKYDKSTSTLYGSKVMMALFAEWLINKKINFKIVKDSYKTVSNKDYMQVRFNNRIQKG